MTGRVPRQVLFSDFNTDKDTIVRGANPSTRRPPTVADGRVYLTIDTACENTVCGSFYMGFVAKTLNEKYNLQPLEQKEFERYCFGPGEPKESNPSPECSHRHWWEALHSSNLHD